MLANAQTVAPGSHHAKFLQLRQGPFAKLKPEEIMKTFRKCTDGAKVPAFGDIQGVYICSLNGAVERGLLTGKQAEHALRVFNERFLTVINFTGTNGFEYQVFNEGRQLHVCELRINGLQMDEGLWKAMTVVHSNEPFHIAKKQIADFLNAETPMFKLPCTMEHGFGVQMFRLAAFLPSEKQGDWIGMCDAMGRTLHEIGFRSSSSATAQEHKLLGSTVWSGYFSQPYKPIGIICKEMDKNEHESGMAGLEMPEAAQARELDIFSKAAPEYYRRSENSNHLPVFYEPLDEFGNTIRDPRLIDTSRLDAFLKRYPLEEAIERCLVRDAKKSKDYPNRRD